MSGRGSRPTAVKRWARRGAAVALVAVAGVGVGYGPRLLRDVDAFRVRRVEVVGTRFTDPYAVVRAAGLGRVSSVFDDADAWRAGVLTMPLVESVTVRRKLPSTITLEVREVEPLALVGGSDLRPVAADGRLLEIDPAGATLDLPILTGARAEAGRVRGAEGLAALGVLAALATRAPELAERISMLELRPGALRVLFRHGGAEALLPVHPTDGQLAQLRLAFADLAARGELGKVRRIDVRFRDQVVVSFLGTHVSG